MGVRSYLIQLLEPRAKKMTGSNPQNPQYWVQKMFGGAGNTAAGVYVNNENALSATAVWRAVSLVAQTIGALPLHIYESEGARTKNKAVNHKLYYTLHTEPNPEQSAMEFREMLQAHALTYGRAHAEIELKGDGRVNLWPLMPDRVEPLRTKEKGSLVYRVHLPNGGHKMMLPDQIYTLRGLGYGLNHTYNVIDLFRESIGLTLAAEEFGARFFGNGASMGGVLQHPHRVGEEAIMQLRQSMEERHKGLEQAHRLLILEEGMQYKEIAVPPDKAQFIETRKYQINDVARIIGVPPHKLAEMSQATFSNIEHQSIEFVQDTINPWCVRWEQSLSRQLLSDTEKKKYFFKHNLAGLVRGDFKTRMEGYSIGRQNGWLSANDIRELEDMNPIEQGDIYLVPMNMEPAGEPKDEPATTKEPETDNLRELRNARSVKTRQRLIDTYEPLFRSAAEEIIKRERADVIREAEKKLKQRNIQVFEEWLNGFFEDHKEYIRKKMAPVIMSFGKMIYADAQDTIDAPLKLTEGHEKFTNSFIDAFIANHIGYSKTRIKKATEQDDIIEALTAEYDSQEEVRVNSIVDEQTVRAANAFAKTAWIIGGVTRFVWVANAGACEFCQSLNGKTVGIDQNFVEPGGSISSATGNSPPMVVSNATSHPPVHGHCKCSIVPK